MATDGGENNGKGLSYLAACPHYIPRPCISVRYKQKSLTYTDDTLTRSKHVLVELGKVGKWLPLPFDILKDQDLCRTSLFFENEIDLLQAK